MEHSSVSEHGRPLAGRLEDRLEFERLISDTSASLLAAPPAELDLAVERTLERLRDFFQVDRCALLSVSRDQQAVHVRLASYTEEALRVSPDVNLVDVFPWSRHRLLVERAPVRISRMADLPPEADAERETWEQMSIRSALTLPVEREGVVSHMIALNSVQRECEWPDEYVTRLRVLGEMIVGALERREMICGLREAEARLASGADLAGLAFYDVDLAKGSAYLDDRLHELCGVPPDREQGLGPLEFWMERLHPDDRRRVLDERERLHGGEIERLSIEYRFLHPGLGERWIQHLAGVTERDAGGRAVATFGVLRDVTRRHQIEDELSDLSRHLIRAHEEERAFLARELHDDLTQRLAVLAIDLGCAEIAASEGVLTEAIRSVREKIVRLSEDVHTLAYHLHPSVLEELGLAEALRTECERLLRQERMEVSLEVDPRSIELGKEAALCLFRVVQAALSNVVRHAGACTASVTLQPAGDGWGLVIRDPGIGFDPGAPGRRRSLGLASMRERVRLMNGRFEIESAPGRGTTVVAWLPSGEGSG